MEPVTILGLVAGGLTTWSLLPQAYRIYKLKHTKDISTWTYEILGVGMLLWLVYGFLTNDIPLMLANSISLAFAIAILAMKFKYG